jgi:transaldolase
LTISPGLLTELQNTVAALPRKLDPAKTASLSIEKISVDKATFDKMHAADRMASDKLSEGIDGFTKALITLEQLLAERLERLEKEMVAAG